MIKIIMLFLKILKIILVELEKQNNLNMVKTKYFWIYKLLQLLLIIDLLKKKFIIGILIIIIENKNEKNHSCEDIIDMVDML